MKSGRNIYKRRKRVYLETSEDLSYTSEHEATSKMSECYEYISDG